MCPQLSSFSASLMDSPGSTSNRSLLMFCFFLDSLEKASKNDLGNQQVHESPSLGSCIDLGELVCGRLCLKLRLKFVEITLSLLRAKSLRYV